MAWPRRRNYWTMKPTVFFARLIAILKHYSRPLGLSLILAALPENQSSFRQISRNPFLIAEGVTIHPDALSLEALRECTWEVLEPEYLKRLAGLVEMFGAARAKELGDDDLAQIAPNACAGRVATLLVEADRVVPGRLDAVTGEIEFAELTDPDVNDITPRCELSKCSSGGLADARFLPNDGGLADRG
jgi:Bacterial archaeo-eukaryotic release factor family 3